MATRNDAVDYSPDIAEALCDHLATGKSVAKFCAIKGNPGKSSIFRWLARYPEFQRLYIAAMQIKGDALVDEMTDLADGNGEPAKVRNQLETRKWIAERAAPKRYGPKVGLEHSGELGFNVIIKEF
jgi:hypothetical protein